MAVTFRIPRFKQSEPAVDGVGRMTTAFFRTLDDVLSKIETLFNQILVIPQIQDALDNLDTATQAAQQAASDAAQAAANAQAQADAAAQAQEAAAKDQALINSYISPASVVTATPTTVSIGAHTRYYADGTSKIVSGGTAPATALGDVDYVSYSDPARAGGAVTYIISTTAPTQTGDVHVVGAVTIPTTGTQNGGTGPRRPGEVQP